jgi:hypothetical protein
MFMGEPLSFLSTFRAKQAAGPAFVPLTMELAPWWRSMNRAIKTKYRYE